MGEGDAAQAVELVRALHDQLREMTTRLSRVEPQSVGTGHLASAMRLEAATLRRGIYDAQKFIDRLQRRYHLDRGDEQTLPGNDYRPG